MPFVRLPSLNELILGGAVAMAVPLAAQDTVRSESSDIVVTGKVATREEARRIAIDFVRQTGVAAQQDSVARWIDRICPKVFGLDPAIAARVANRIRASAELAGARLAREPCRSNLAVVFTDNAMAFVQDVAKRDPKRISQMSLGDRELLRQGETPVRWWYSFETRSKHGSRTHTGQVPGSGGAGSEGEGAQSGATGGGSIIAGNDTSTTLSQYNSSIVSTQAVRALTGATVVIDVNRALGRDLDAVASYAAFVALAETRLSAKPEGSVLSLFASDAPPAGLTDRDEAFLKAVYALPLDRKIGQQRSRIVGALTDAAMAGS
jgi:hypothetical protein